jgi:hypothetical protein
MYPGAACFAQNSRRRVFESPYNACVKHPGNAHRLLHTLMYPGAACFAQNSRRRVFGSPKDGSVEHPGNAHVLLTTLT